jgi:hypothetical protein
MVRRPELRGHCSLVVDGTGGGGVVDLLRASDLDCELVPVQITGCGAVRKEAGQWNVPKRDLIAVVQVLLEQDRLSFALEMPGIRRLLDELMAMRTRVTPEGNSQYGAWREGSHDDLALAVAGVLAGEGGRASGGRDEQRAAGLEPPKHFHFIHEPLTGWIFGVACSTSGLRDPPRAGLSHGLDKRSVPGAKGIYGHESRRASQAAISAILRVADKPEVTD